MTMKRISSEKLKNLGLNLYIGFGIALWVILIYRVIEYHVSNGIY